LLVVRSKGAEGTALITDAMPPVGADTSSFRLQGRQISLREGACYMEDGTLAGSALSMNRAVRLMSSLARVPLLECVRMATTTPARALGLQDEIGTLKPGARADIAVCDPDLNVWKVFVGGELAYAADAARS
jgi:N-acetylglucosamine-6-phosphate deacetylase